MPTTHDFFFPAFQPPITPPCILPGIFDVFLSTGNRPADAPAAGASAAMHRQQRAAVFSEPRRATAGAALRNCAVTS
jgi:hypothetical protein